MHKDDSASRAHGLLTYLIVAVLAAAGGVGTALAVHRPALRQDSLIAAAAAGQAGAMNDDAVYARVEPGIVDVVGNLQYLQETAEGTGIVINAAAGLVLTNNHVIDGATSVTVTPVTSGRSYQARVVGYDRADDVAVLQLPAGITGLKAVTIGNSAQVTVGTPVLAIGNEAGQGGAPTVAPGVISSLDRTIEASDQSLEMTELLHGMLQTNADIRPGDSGGPLADAAGQVIGIDTAAGGSTDYSGYAIPINEAVSIADRIAARHRSTSIDVGLPAFLGTLVSASASASPARQASAERQLSGAVTSNPAVCLTSDTTEVPATIAPAPSGALVDGVLCGTAAWTAGISAGDVITSVGGQPVTSPDSLDAILGGYRPGRRVTVDWTSLDGIGHTALVTLGAGPAA